MERTKELRARAARYRGHAVSVSDPKMAEAVLAEADRLDAEAARMETPDHGILIEY